MNRHKILFNYYSKYNKSGGYLDYELTKELNQKGDDIIDLTVEAAETMVNMKFPMWSNIGSNDYNNLLNFFLTNDAGIEMVIRLITYWRYYTYISPNKSKYERSPEHEFKDLITDMEQYKLVCIAFHAEYQRLKNKYEDDILKYSSLLPTNRDKTILSEFHKEEYWKEFELFVKSWICSGWIAPPKKGQEWIKNRSVSQYGIDILKQYAPFIDEDRLLLPSKITKWIKTYEINTILQCSNLSKGGGKMYTFYNKYIKYTSKKNNN
jgi:hypothetical protein